MAWPLAAMGVGALMGGLGAKQRGGNFLKGAMEGAALGGATGFLGAKFSGQGGIFGLGKKMLPNFLAMSGIGMGTEMLGQSEANKVAKLRQQAWLDEEEERRLARLNKMTGYDVGDPKNFLTPESYFMASGGITTTPQYANGGWSRKGYYPGGDVATDMQYVDPDLYSPTGEGGGPGSNPIQQIPMGPEGSFADEFESLDMGAMNPEIQKLYQAFLVANQATEEEVPVEMFMQLMQQQGGGQQGGGQQGPMMAAQGGGQQGPMMAAEGGIADLDMRGGGHSMGPGTGTSDDVPAMLSDGEFVMTANAVSNLGGGDRMVGAQRMYNMMNQLDPNSQTPGEMNVAGYG